MSMTFQECLRGRRSVRKYKSDPIPPDVIEGVIADASYAPSWKNSQTVRYIVVKDPALKQQLAETCMMDFELNRNNVRSAPAVVLVTTVANRSGYERDGSFSTDKGTHWESFDAGIATGILCLAAHAAGLGTVVMGIFDTEKITKLANIPEEQKLSALVAIGYPDERPNMPKRKEAANLLDYR